MLIRGKRSDASSSYTIHQRPVYVFAADIGAAHYLDYTSGR
jgi:hypothetical protein